MDFEIQPLKEIQWKVSALHGYAEVLQKKFTKDIETCLNNIISVFESQSGDIYRFILTNQWEHIWDCKVIIDNTQKIFYVSSIAIVPNLQKKWISKKFYTTVIIPKFSTLYPWYIFAPWIEQTDLWKKLWNNHK